MPDVNFKAEDSIEMSQSTQSDNSAKGQNEIESGASPETMSFAVPNEPANYSSKKSHKKLILIVISVVLLLLVAGGSIFGFSYYKKYVKQVAVESLLPYDPNVAMEVTIDLQSEQFRLLETNMEKFPGYKALLKMSDEKKAYASISEMITDKFSQHNLSFSDDIKPVLSENAHIIFPKISPIGDEIETSILLSKARIANQIGMTLDPTKKDQLALDTLNGNIGPKVMGESEIGQVDDSQEKKKQIELVDFIAGAEVKDLKKAKEVLDKIRVDSKIGIEEIEYNKYLYFKTKITSDKENKTDDHEDLDYSYHSLADHFSYPFIYQALIGGNWILSSNEELIKSAIEKHIGLSSFSGLAKSDSDEKSFSDSQEIIRAKNNISQNSTKNILAVYYNFKPKEVVPPKDCSDYELKNELCENILDYFNFPEKISGGMVFKAQEDGLVFINSADKFSQTQISDVQFDSGIATKIPEKLNGKWTDIYYEYFNPKQRYDYFKKNILTEKGREEFGQYIDEIGQEYGINFETDIIDQLGPSVATMVFCYKNQEPEGALVLEVQDPSQTKIAIQKMIENYKNSILEFYRRNLESYSQDSYATSPEYKKYIEESKKLYQERIDQLTRAGITETPTEFGLIYSFKLPESYYISFDYAFKDHTLIIGSHYATVESLLRETSQPVAEKVANNQFFKKTTQGTSSWGYSNMFISTLGLWNAIEYEIRSLVYSSDDSCINQASCLSSPSYDQVVEDALFVSGSVLKTVKLAGVTKSSTNGFTNTNYYFNIQQINGPDKEKAEALIEKLLSEIEIGRTKSNNASIMSLMSSVLPVASMCINDGGTVSQPKEGELICNGIEDLTEKWPSLGTLEDDGYAYGSLQGDILTATKDGALIVSCNIADGSCEMLD